jgi:hypothetical protein
MNKMKLLLLILASASLTSCYFEQHRYDSQGNYLGSRAMKVVLPIDVGVVVHNRGYSSGYRNYGTRYYSYGGIGGYVIPRKGDVVHKHYNTTVVQKAPRRNNTGVQHNRWPQKTVKPAQARAQARAQGSPTTRSVPRSRPMPRSTYQQQGSDPTVRRAPQRSSQRVEASRAKARTLHDR